MWDLAQQLLTITRASVQEAARTRFRVNFGTERCKRCEGLKAGPQVVATCFQVQQCYYTNFKEGTLTPKQARVLELFLGSAVDLDPS